MSAAELDAAHAARMRDANPARVSPEQKERVTRELEGMATVMRELGIQYAETERFGRKLTAAMRRDRTKLGTTARRGKAAPGQDDLTQPLYRAVRYACEPNPDIGRWHVTEITPELLAAREALS